MPAFARPEGRLKELASLEKWLFSVLKAAFSDHSRITLMIQSFGKGLDIVAVATQEGLFGNLLAYEAACA